MNIKIYIIQSVIIHMNIPLIIEIIERIISFKFQIDKFALTTSSPISPFLKIYQRLPCIEINEKKKKNMNREKPQFTRNIGIKSFVWKTLLKQDVQF